jgi:hypothetical protein
LKRSIIPVIALLLCAGSGMVMTLRMVDREDRAAAVVNVNGLSDGIAPDLSPAADERIAQFMDVLRIRDYVDAWQQIWEPAMSPSIGTSGQVESLARRAKPLIGWQSYKTLDTEIGPPTGSRDAIVRISAVDAKGRSVRCWFFLMQSRDGGFKVFGFGFPPSEPPGV